MNISCLPDSQENMWLIDVSGAKQSLCCPALVLQGRGMYTCAFFSLLFPARTGLPAMSRLFEGVGVHEGSGLRLLGLRGDGVI